MSSAVVDNVGSTARDFCMLERNLLSHFKLGLLLSLLSSSFLLHARLSVDQEAGPEPPSTEKAALPLAIIELVAAIAIIFAGLGEYWSGDKDLRNMRAFLYAHKYHTIITSFVAGLVLVTCIIELCFK